jgi:hypothetical protein
MPLYEATLDGHVVQLEGDHEPSEQEVRQAMAEYAPAKPQEPALPQTSAIGAFGRQLAKGILPAYAARAGGELGTALGIESGPGAIAAGFAGALGASALTATAQEPLINAVFPQAKAYETADIQQHPVASRLGGFFSGGAAFKFQPFRGAAAIPDVLRGTATQAQKQAALALPAAAGLGAAAGVVSPLLSGGTPTWGSALEGLGMGLTYGPGRRLNLGKLSLLAGSAKAAPQATAEAVKNVAVDAQKAAQEAPEAPKTPPEAETPQAQPAVSAQTLPRELPVVDQAAALGQEGESATAPPAPPAAAEPRAAAPAPQLSPEAVAKPAEAKPVAPAQPPASEGSGAGPGKPKVKPTLEQQRRAVMAKVDANQKLTPAERKIFQGMKGGAAPDEPHISAGPGAASPGDVPNTPPEARAIAGRVESAAPENRPFGGPSVVGTKIRSALSELRLATKGMAGESMPRTTAANRELGESGVRYGSSRIAAGPMAKTFAGQVLEGTGVDPIKFGAALVEDNLRSIRESARQDATRLLAEGKPNEAAAKLAEADKVSSIIGSQGSPFRTEDEYFDFLAEPGTQRAIQQHVALWQEVIDPMYREAQGIDPDVQLPTRGQQTGARVNLRAVLRDEPASRRVYSGTGAPNLTATFKRKSPFGIQARGSGLAYDVDYNSLISNTFERQLEIANKNAFDNKLVETGNAVIDKPGQQVMIGDERGIAFPLVRKSVVVGPDGSRQAVSLARNIYVRESLAREYRMVSNVDAKFKIPFVTATMNVLNKAALAGLTDFTVHTSNLMTALFNRPVSGKLFADSLLSATGRADVPVTLVKTILKAFQNNDAQIAELSRIGAMRPEGTYMGLTGRILKSIDKITRLTLDDTFKSLVDQGLVENTETARREYVNQIGQYNRRLQGPLTQFLRDTGFGPFVTAGKTFNALGLKMMTLSPGAEASTPLAGAMLRANVLSKWVGAAVLVGTLNYLLTKDKKGGVMGRPGTPLGSIDTGKNDKAGRLLTFPLLNLLGLGRGLRVTGAKGFIDAKRLGLTTGDAFDSAARDIFNSLSAPAAGPPVRLAAIAATGYPPAVNVGRASRVVPPGENQHLENAKEALRQANPIYQTYLKYRQGKSLSEIASSQLPRFTLMPGKTQGLTQNYPRIVAAAQANEFEDDVVRQAKQMPMEKRYTFIMEQIQRLPPDLRSRALGKVRSRGVFKR